MNHLRAALPLALILALTTSAFAQEIDYSTQGGQFVAYILNEANMTVIECPQELTDSITAEGITCVTYGYGADLFKREVDLYSGYENPVEPEASLPWKLDGTVMVGAYLLPGGDTLVATLDESLEFGAFSLNIR